MDNLYDEHLRDESYLMSIVDDTGEDREEVRRAILLKIHIDVPYDLRVALERATRLFAEFNKRTYKGESLEYDYQEFAVWTAHVVEEQLNSHRFLLTATELEECRVALRFALEDAEFGYDCMIEDLLTKDEVAELRQSKHGFEEVERVIGGWDDVKASKHPGRSLTEWFQ